MNWDKEEGKDEQPMAGRVKGNTALAEETVRSAASQVIATANPTRGEERLSIFWRVFGGTLLSIVALVVITIYQQMTSTITDLENRLNRLNEARADLVKNAELSNRMTSVWSSIKGLQAANATTTVLQERMAVLEQQLKSSDEERKELTRDVQGLQQRLALVEGKQAVTTPTPLAVHKSE